MGIAALEEPLLHRMKALVTLVVFARWRGF